MQRKDKCKAGVGKPWSAIVLVAALAAVALVPSIQAQPAQAQEAPLPSTNLSVSGSATLPAIGIAPNGLIHALWWDELDGTRYARGRAGVTETTWSNSVVVPGIVGLRRVDQNTRQVTLQPPANLQLQADVAGAAHAAWFDNTGQLLYSQASGANANWSAPSVLAPGAAAVAMNLDISGTLRIAFVQTSSTQQSPAGVYYLVRAGNTFRRTLAFPSTYFRTSKPGEVNVSVASDGNNAIVAWSQIRDGNSFSVHTVDGGKTWSPPEPVVPRGEGVGVPIRVVVGVEGVGRFLMMWRDASAPGCGLFQKESADAGATWSTPGRVLTSLTRCPEWWQMSYLADGQIALLGTPSTSPTPDVQSGLLSIWNGDTWSQSIGVTLLYQDANSQSVRSAGCIDLAIAGNMLATIGCDMRGDIWSSVRMLDPSAIAEAGAATWESSQLLTTNTTVGQPPRDVRDVTLAVDQTGSAYAAWSVATQQGKPATSLQVSRLSDGGWSEPKEVLNLSSASNNGGEASVVQTAQPSIAVGGDGKLHMVWSGGESGRAFYSSAFTRDVLDDTRWMAPAMLPAPSPIGSSPQIVANLETGRLSVIYTVPFNEDRGVYLTQSNDSGATWLTPTKVFDAMANGWEAVGSSRLAFDREEGVFHAVWMKTPLPGASGERALFYARSEDGGRSWSQAVQIDTGQIEQPQLMMIGPKSLMLTWQERSPSTESADTPLQVWWQVSPFGGERWTQPAVLNGFDRVSGDLGIATDGAGRAYLAALGRGISGEASLLYTEWSGMQWSQPEVTSLSQPSEAGNGAILAVLNNAKQLQSLMRISTLRQDGQREFGVVTLSRAVEASAVNPLPTFTPVPPRAQATAILLPEDTPEPTPMAVSNATPASSSDTPSFILLGAGLALVVLTAGIVISFAVSRRR
jgi:hypothetical protein